MPVVQNRNNSGFLREANVSGRSHQQVEAHREVEAPAETKLFNYSRSHPNTLEHLPLLWSLPFKIS